MNAIKTVTMFQALDGSHQPTERAALLVSVAYLIGCSRECVEQDIEPELSRLLPLLAKLNDPRNQPPRTSVTVKPGGHSWMTDPDGTGEAGTIIDPSALSMPFDQLTLEDFRPGQLLELAGDPAITGILDHIDPTPEDEHQLALRQMVDGVPLSHWNVAAKVTEVVRILKQPEELLTLDEARQTLRDLENTDHPVEGAAQRHKSRILLHRRIAELEAMEGTRTHAASDD